MPEKRAGEITEQATRLLREYVESGRTRTDILKQVASLIVDLRALHTLDDGRVDWSGRSPGYRAAMNEIYRGAGVTADKADTVQAALRYHVGNLLRDRASDEALEEVGLTSITPKARLARQREVVAALATTGSVAEVLNDPLRLLAHAEVLLDYIEPADLRGLRGKERVAARHVLTGLRERCDALGALVAPRGGSSGGAATAV